MANKKVRIEVAPFKGAEGEIIAVNKGQATISGTINDRPFQSVFSVGEFTELDELDIPAFEVPMALQVSETYGYMGYELMTSRLQRGIYETPETFYLTPQQKHTTAKEDQKKLLVEAQRITSILSRMFIDDIRVAYELEDIPDKAFNKMWEIAWDRGHSSGYHDVLIAFDEMTEIIDGYKLVSTKI